MRLRWRVNKIWQIHKYRKIQKGEQEVEDMFTHKKKAKTYKGQK